jgi:CheY-like chemotaxis protein
MSKIKCRVLCVDDHEDSAEMLRQLLSVEDYEVSTANSMKEGLALAKSEAFDLYVLDRHLPDGTGLELCRKLNELTPDTPCIFYSGDAYEVHRRQALAAGADGYVAKPDIDELIDTVHKLLAERECATAVAS